MDEMRRQTDEDLKTTEGSRQEETQQHAKADEDFKKATEANKKTQRNDKSITSPGAMQHYRFNWREPRISAKRHVIYDTYQNRQGKAILTESRKRLKELSEKQEDRKKDMTYLQERQLENYRQWDSQSKENQPIVMEKADINYRSKNGESLLHTACLHGELHMVQLLQSKCPLLVHQCDSKGRSVCHSAAAGGSVGVLNFLVEQGADPLCKDVDGMNLLQYACLEGKKEMAFHLMDTYSIMLCNVGKGGYTVSHCAAYGGNIDIFKRVRKLINISSRVDSTNHSVEDPRTETQADLTSRTETGETLLHMACWSDKLEMTQYLVEKYPDIINEVSKHKASLVHYAAAEGGNISVLQYLIDQGLDPWCRTATQQTLLHLSCIGGRLEITEYLLEKYPDMISKVDNCSRTPAHYAAYGGRVSVIQTIQGRDLLCATDAQQTFPHRSCIRSQLEIIKFLAKKYPDIISWVDSCNETTAHYAAQSSNISVLQYLIDQGLDPWCRTATQETLLHKSCIAGQLEMTQYLLEKYPDMIKEVDNRKRTPVHYAAQSSNTSVLKYLIDQGLDTRCRTDTQETLLHMSCIAGRLEMTQYLVEKYPAMVNDVDKRNETPGHYACQGSNVSVLQYLINQGLDPWSRTCTQETLLHVAAISGQLEMSKYLVEKYPEMINKVDICKETAGHYAAYGGHVSILQYLIDQDLDPWCTTIQQQTLLHQACIAGQLEMSKYLAEKFSDMINEVDSSAETPAQCAAYGGNLSILQYLIDKGLDPWCTSYQQQTLLHQSCLNGQLEMSKYLVETYPIMITEVEYCNASPAHYAAASGNVSVLQYLIKQGLDPWCRTATEETLLHRSCMAGQLEMTKYVVEQYPGMIDEVDNCKRTPGHYAAQSGNVSLLQYLIHQGQDPWCRTATQETLLHRSCLAGHLEMTKFLVENYPDMINKVDNRKQTPAHFAVQSSNVSVLQYLIDQGQDPWCRTATQETVLHKACIAGELEMTQYLLVKYSDLINEVTIRKETPGHYAVQSGKVLVLQYLFEKGLNPWCRTTTQETLLHKTCIVSPLETIQCVLKRYPDTIKKGNKSKRTPVNHATVRCNVSVLQNLIGEGLNPRRKTATQESLLVMSYVACHLEMVHYLVENYPTMINEVDKCKETPGHYSSLSGNVSVLQYLIDQGLDPWCRTATQETLLHKACIAGHSEMTQYLVQKYPDMIYKVNDSKTTPAHYAALRGQISVLQYIINHGLDPWCRTVTQETLLHMSCLAGELEMTQYLIEKYPNMINEVDKRKRTPSHVAALSSNIPVLQYLIDQGLDPWCRTATQETLLHMSRIAGQLEMTYYLVETYPDMINKVDNCNRTSGHFAAQSGNVSVLQYLIRQGLDPRCTTTTLETLLHRSSKAGKLEMTRYLVEKYPDMINKVDSSKGTPAHYAAQSSNVSVLQYLIDQGLDPWCRTATQQTLLHMSCIAGQLEMTHYLVEKYPNMTHFIMVDNYRKSPAHYAAQSGNVAVLQYLIDKGVDPWCRTATQETLLHRSSNAGQLEMSKYLVEKYPDMINTIDMRNGTPAHYAAQSNNVSVLQYLIDQGLDPWCRTATQETLLHMSCISGQLEMTQYLVEKYPGMINKVNNCGNSCASYAAQSGNISVLQYLIDQGLDPWRRTDTQETLLHMSCIAGQLKITQYLIEKYPDMINEVNNCKETPGHYAAERGYVSILQYLIDKGLDPWCRTSTQQTLLHRSSNAGQLEMSKYLVEKYPDMIIEVDNCNRTSGHCAAQSGNVSLLQYLIDQGLNPWCRTATQQTLLHIALIAARIKVVKYLVERYPAMISTVQFNMQF